MSAAAKIEAPDIFHLTIGDRFNLLGMLPEKGKFAKARLIDKLRHALRLSQYEEKFYEVTYTPTGGVGWTKDETKQNKTRELKIGLSGRELIRKVLQECNDREELSPFAAPLYEKFMLDVPKETDEDIVEASPDEELP